MGEPKKDGGTLVLRSGETFPLIGETNRLWLCQGTQFRKSNSAVKEILPPEAEEKGKDPSTKERE